MPRNSFDICLGQDHIQQAWPSVGHFYSRNSYCDSMNSACGHISFHSATVACKDFGLFSTQTSKWKGSPKDKVVDLAPQGHPVRWSHPHWRLLETSEPSGVVWMKSSVFGLREFDPRAVQRLQLERTGWPSFQRFTRIGKAKSRNPRVCDLASCQASHAGMMRSRIPNAKYSVKSST